MSLEAGKLRHRVQIEARSIQRGQDTGSVTYVWNKIANGDEWASIEDFSTREFVAAAAVQSKATSRIVMRFRPDITAAMRIVHNGTVYSIEGQPLRDKESGMEYMTLPVSRGANLGA